MAYDFETLTPPNCKCSYVWDYVHSRIPGNPDGISYAVAEMKFPLAPEIKKALHDCVEDGYFGYGQPADLSRTAAEFMALRHNWNVKPEWIVQSYGVVSAIAIAIRALTEAGDGILIQTPVYNPFFEQISFNGRRVVDSPLLRRDDRYEVDFEDFEGKAADPTVKMFVLCSPHNPVGRVWSRQELERMADICEKYGLIVVSDEIHHDLVYAGEHTVFGLVSPWAEQNSIVCTAPSKSFNIPGLNTSNIIIPNDELRDKFAGEFARCSGHFMNLPGITASTAAYKECCGWLDELQDYLKGNAEYFRSLVNEKLPGAWTPKMEGTYLAWLDMSYLGLSDRELEELIIEKAGLLVNMGKMYGPSGSGFIRVNIGCPRCYIKIFVDSLAKALESL